MGAANTTPQTVHITNPNEHKIHVSTAVVDRLKNAHNQNEERSEKNKIQSQKIDGIYGIYDSQAIDNYLKEMPQKIKMKHDELKKREYIATMTKFETVVGSPVKWTVDHESEINDLRKRLFECYKKHPKELLLCSKEAREFQEYIFKEQYKSILKLKESNIYGNGIMEEASHIIK